ncbi:RTA1-domain-containing protein [Acephala macrosclerotiorum]|nr:RTA1-domain-containing protein [Acephala macrosclerotiorum]
MAGPAPSHPDVNDPNLFAFYRYDPSQVAALIFMSCFLITTVFHIFQAAKLRTFYFIPLLVGGVFEVFGYIARSLAHNNQYSLAIYIMQELLLLLAPALFAASIYMTLGRMILLTQGEKLAPIPARWLTKIFVCGDVLSFVVQSGGGLMAVPRMMTIGEHLVVFGLLIQIISFGIFVLAAGVFHYHVVCSPTPASLQVHWRRYMYTLYAASALIFIRSVFRVIEFSGGNDGFLMKSEVFVYVFEGLLMLCVMVSFNIVHPGELISRRPLSRIITMMEGQDGTEGESKTSFGQI